jgi:hypothetical protein
MTKTLQQRAGDVREGDKQMLMNVIRKSYRDMFGHVEPVQAVVTVPATLAAANASHFSQPEMRARRLRRQRRLDRAGQQGRSGWSLRTW